MRRPEQGPTVIAVPAVLAGMVMGVTWQGWRWGLFGRDGDGSGGVRAVVGYVGEKLVPEGVTGQPAR